VFFSYDTEIESDVVVHPHVIFGEGVSVKSGSSVGPFSVIEGSCIDNATVGPFARLRGESVIGEGARIGNFVEIKNSHVSSGTKISHLSYIGDCFIGKNVNIGAGTITCNYDGFRKHNTHIGDDVFIGSNAALVAPVRIDSNSMIGAGSVITKNVAAGDLAIAREQQQNITDGAVVFRAKRKDKPCAE
jgi:bifunctional UDP-N-acetylglucosamine pyrophosphorylase/glucosamine-1-phosphate N-acetyltransferase